MKKIFLLAILFSSLRVCAQNLVINPGFEDTLQCPYFVSQIDFASNWLTSVNTPDYYNACNNNGAVNPGMVGVPNSARGYQPARTGDAFAGVVIYWTAQTDYREIFYAPLQTALTAGTIYNVGMYVVLNEDNAMWAVDGGLGIYLSSSPINPSTPFAYTPQVVNTAGNVLNDSLNWTLISGTYTATGGEQYITIGSFIPDSMLTIFNRGGSYPFTSYAIDDVWVIPDSLMTGIKEFPPKRDLMISPNPSSGNFQVQFYAEKYSEAKCEILNVTGEKIFEKRVFAKPGYNSFSFNEGWNGAGIFFIKILCSEKLYTQKIIIQHCSN